jgi:outer membrane lipoprotein-sorting protein
MVIDIDPFGESVKRESLMPINEIGFTQLLDRTIRTLEQDVAADPSGDNTTVEHITTVTINGRPCEMLRITHPLRRDGLQFFSASMCVDSELHVPVRFDVYDWPETPGQQPPLTAEFTYTNVTLNANLDDAAFAPAVLRSP